MNGDENIEMWMFFHNSPLAVSPVGCIPCTINNIYNNIYQVIKKSEDLTIYKSGR